MNITTENSARKTINLYINFYFMSSIDMSNAKVVQNHLNAQAREGRGKFSIRKDVVIFKSEDGLEMICPDEMQAEKLKELGADIPKIEKKVVKTAPKVEELGVNIPKIEKKDQPDDELVVLRARAKELKIPAFALLKKDKLKEKVKNAERFVVNKD